MLIYIIDVTDGFEKGIVHVIVTLLQQRIQKTFWSDFMIIRKLIRSLYDPEQIFVINLSNCSALSDSLLPPATKLGQGYVFTGVCDSVHRGGCLPQCILGYPTTLGADTTPEQTPLGADTPWSRHPPRADTSPWEQTSPQADSPQKQTPPCCRACWEIW